MAQPQRRNFAPPRRPVAIASAWPQRDEEGLPWIFTD
jgi:hypothetical protein